MLARSVAQASVLTSMPLLTYIVVMQPAAPATPEPEEEKPKEKPKDPLAALPPSKMVLDSWKRLYSNTPAAKFQEICVSGLWNGADSGSAQAPAVLLTHRRFLLAIVLICVNHS